MDFINIFLIIIGITNLFLALIIYFNAKQVEKINLSFSLLALNVSAWSLSMTFFRMADHQVTALVALKILYLVPIFIPIIFLYFIYSFLEKNPKILGGFPAKIGILTWALILSGLTVFSNKFLTGLDIPLEGEKIIYFGKLYYVYIIHFILLFGLSFAILANKYIKEKNLLTKEQIKYLFLGTSISSTIGMLTNLILPWLGFFTLNWLGNIMTIFLVTFILYAILKYELFDIKIVAVEVFIIFIFINLFIDIFFVSSVSELIIKTLIIISVVFLSYLIIKSVYKDIQDRKQIEKLATDLKEANTQLKKMDKQKSEFVSIASHQLRAPIASLKGYSSMIMEGSYGPVSADVMKVAERLFQSSQSLSVIVDDFLNLSRIERGKIDFSFEKGNLREILEQALNEIKPSAENKKIKIIEEILDKNYIIKMDSGKIKQAISNILDNSLKYTEKGSVEIKLSKTDDGKALLMIRDTGIGLPKKEIPELFKKFSRLDNANNANIKGTGLGLFLAKTIIEAHHGKIWAESEGRGKGSTFFIELKLI